MLCEQILIRGTKLPIQFVFYSACQVFLFLSALHLLKIQNLIA